MFRFSPPLKMSLRNPSRLGVFWSDATFKDSVLVMAVKAARDALSKTLDTGENTWYKNITNVEQPLQNMTLLTEYAAF